MASSPTTLHRAAPSALEQSLIDLCDRHGLTAISFGMNLKQRDEARFDANAHWDGFSRRNISCTGEMGATIAEALEKTLARAIAERTPYATATLADEALPELAA